MSTSSIVCVFETWLQTIPVNLATIFPKYTKYLQRNWRDMDVLCRGGGGGGGGIVVFINKQFEQYITKVDINSECGIFLKIKKELLSLNKDLLLMCLYLPQQVHIFMTIPR